MVITGAEGPGRRDVLIAAPGALWTFRDVREALTAATRQRVDLVPRGSRGSLSSMTVAGSPGA